MTMTSTCSTGGLCNERLSIRSPGTAQCKFLMCDGHSCHEQQISSRINTAVHRLAVSVILGEVRIFPECFGLGFQNQFEMNRIGDHIRGRVHHVLRATRARRDISGATSRTKLVFSSRENLTRVPELSRRPPWRLFSLGFNSVPILNPVLTQCEAAIWPRKRT